MVNREISYIGSGSAGGKGSGLIKIHSYLTDLFPDSYFKGTGIGVPQMTVIKSDVFSSFISQNRLNLEELSDLRDEQISEAFRKASFPAVFSGQLYSLVKRHRGPLAVRSSSLTEDSLDSPFAGIFATKMIPNNNPNPDRRFRELLDAIKFIYASTWHTSSRDAFAADNIDLASERMSVIIQNIHGSRRDSFFYPAFSGVARSFNYYPFGDCNSEDGVAELAAGLGKTVVDGGRRWIFMPTAPEVPPPASLKDLLDSGQTNFWAVNMMPPEKDHPFAETEFMKKLPSSVLEKDGLLRHICSTYAAASDRLEMGISGPGFRLIDFSPMLKARINSFSEILVKILDDFKAREGCDVEIELAVDFSPSTPANAEIGLLQLRPVRKHLGDLDLSGYADDCSKRIIYSENALGNIVINGVSDLVYIPPEKFIPSRTGEMPLELEKINREITGSGGRYVLAGFGRWGSSDPALGIPARWSQISGSAAIIESTISGMDPSLSQGSHFFHNILNKSVPYLSIEGQKASEKGFIDYEFLSGCPKIYEGRFFDHIKLPNGIKIIVDGKNRTGIISL